MNLTENNEKNGFILLDKPKGPSSHAMVNFLRRLTKIKKIGHAGTLDPLASGLLILGIGRPATKQLGKFLKQNKEYEAEIFLGAETKTYDAEGEIKIKYFGKEIEKDKIIETLKTFLGEQDQEPPMYSAKKIGGKKLYDLARKNINIERPKNRITIDKIELLNYNWPELKILISCSSGTYIRSLAKDFGDRLKTGAYLKNLRRTKIGFLTIDQTVESAKIKEDNWIDYLKDLK